MEAALSSRVSIFAFQQYWCGWYGANTTRLEKNSPKTSVNSATYDNPVLQRLKAEGILGKGRKEQKKKPSVEHKKQLLGAKYQWKSRLQIQENTSFAKCSGVDNFGERRADTSKMQITCQMI